MAAPPVSLKNQTWKIEIVRISFLKDSCPIFPSPFVTDRPNNQHPKGDGRVDAVSRRSQDETGPDDTVKRHGGSLLDATPASALPWFVPACFVSLWFVLFYFIVF